MADGFDDAILGQALPCVFYEHAFSRTGNAQTFIPWISYSPYWNIDRNNGLVCAFETCQTRTLQVQSCFGGDPIYASSWPFQTRSATAGLSNVEGVLIRLATSRNFVARTESRFADRKSLSIYQLTNRTCTVRSPTTRSCCRSLPTAICQGMSISRPAARKNRRPIPSEPLARHSRNVSHGHALTVDRIEAAQSIPTDYKALRKAGQLFIVPALICAELIRQDRT